VTNIFTHESNFNHISRKAAKPAKKILCVSASLREIKRIFTSRQSETWSRQLIDPNTGI
jgi:hypothetical protein